MATLTALQTVNAALRKNGIGSPQPAQRNNALQDLNSMISSWSTEGLLIPNLTWENFNLVAGTGSYTIGSSGTFDTVRPVRIVSAYLRDSNGLDIPIEVDMAVQEYNKIYLKTTQARPEKLHYKPAYPLGTIYFDNVPDLAYTLYIQTEKPLTELAALTTTVSLSDEYKMALIFNLAVLIAPDFDNQLSQEVFALAAQSKSTLINNNLRIKPVEVDSALRWNRAFSGNINTG